ncbi:hypothetical protein RRG08_055239 [Elysia crispata]|uniref:Uncharacterized protein n=1 Tax=Elysia crispata TaxID=231223 RepID=A0AAE0XVV5_9GAST|nr:hypothetical protein RRG08_055239 [Elysia crispata]
MCLARVPASHPALLPSQEAAVALQQTRLGDRAGGLTASFPADSRHAHFRRGPATLSAGAATSVSPCKARRTDLDDVETI